ncbi:hypothetical protein [Acinetobacter sp.]|uniref:hypothetical protein n=1 Tax=Acinetobacter sp. TaxID=472 RepID=UPI003CFC10CE
MKDQEFKQIRAAVADYIVSEGCSCCEADCHNEDAEVLAKLLKVKKYKDGSGYDFYAYSPKWKKYQKEKSTNKHIT